MIKPKPRKSRWQALLDVTSAPAASQLPAAVPAERRDATARTELLCRVHSEFEEMPGLTLTPAQAARFFGLPPTIASRILMRLTDARVLRQKRDGQFSLCVEET